MLVLLLFIIAPIFGAQTNNKWIVVTTINYPSQALKKLAELPDWNLIVVGDIKTPQDWHLEHCIYLSPDNQKQLGFAITQFLPWNHYSRKNIGYLYAIQHGAEVIYDTDDDNMPIDSSSIQILPESTDSHLAQETNSNVINPYAYFGKKEIWPRGYPLEKILDSQKHLTTQVNQKAYPYIQQGLVNLDPDVDAIFRLTHITGNIVFDNNKDPLCLPKNILAPFNSQNTIFLKPALWGLLIPITTTFRVCDIWRGYWTQRLLWDIKGNLCFTAPSANQIRNPHNLMHDFIDEADLYTKAGLLVTFLNKWQSNTVHFFDRCKELTNALIEHHFYEAQEAALLNAWISDLQQIGYKEPNLKEQS